MSTPTKPHLNVIARAPFHVYFEGEAYGITAKNKVGAFDILPGHADFFSVLVPCDVTVTTEEEELTFAIRTGIVSVRDDAVMLFVNM